MSRKLFAAVKFPSERLEANLDKAILIQLDQDQCVACAARYLLETSGVYQ